MFDTSSDTEFELSSVDEGRSLPEQVVTALNRRRRLQAGRHRRRRGLRILGVPSILPQLGIETQVLNLLFVI
jgi:hypothetical protein